MVKNQLNIGDVLLSQISNAKLVSKTLFESEEIQVKCSCIWN